ncbi:unnamed protein product [Candidula unifasciata]|uniref:Dermatopontin n=1 Tax=Candidula unifasciata TaxID=100452 RepID=A0A8S3ZE28_9EUPU|nr:unnamed protein product [Candidula unifasciata]
MTTMLPTITVCLLVLVQGWYVVDGQYVNGFDENARFECPANKTLSFIGSIHSNRYKDRRWQYKCRLSPGATSDCYWTNYLNAFEQRLQHNCPGDEVVNGMMSYHSDQYQDRRFMLRCCRVASKATKNCYHTAFVNYWEKPVNFNVPTGRAIKGVYSIHNNHRKDRRWQFYVCHLA